MTVEICRTPGMPRLGRGLIIRGLAGRSHARGWEDLDAVTETVVLREKRGPPAPLSRQPTVGRFARMDPIRNWFIRAALHEWIFT